MTNKRKFTKEEKLQLLNEAQQNGVKSTLEKHGIYPGELTSVKKHRIKNVKILWCVYVLKPIANYQHTPEFSIKHFFSMNKQCFFHLLF